MNKFREGDALNIGIKSHTGKVRETNQDYTAHFYNTNQQLLAVLCDGMGGHNAGDVASEMAAVHMGHAWETTSFDSIEEVKNWMDDEINIENTRIYEKSLQYKDLEGMGTTIVAAAFYNEKVLIANVGDSRAYLLENASLRQITEDHSFVNELMKRGEISSEESKHHPNRNVLMRSLGVEKKLEVDFFDFQFKEGDILILCSDGLSNLVSEEKMEMILNDSTSPQKKTETLVSEALKNGGFDNISVLLVEYSKEGGV